jgi:hypothetical protein
MRDLTFSIDKNIVTILADGEEVDKVTFPSECTEEEIKKYIEKYIRSIRTKPLKKGKKP